MPTFSLFQPIIAVLLLSAAIRGKGSLFQVFELPKDVQAAVHPKLRRLYLIGGLLALAETATALLQSAMFTATPAADGMAIRQDLTIPGLEFLTYRLLNNTCTVLSLAVVVLLAGVLFWLNGKRTK